MPENIGENQTPKPLEELKIPKKAVDEQKVSEEEVLGLYPELEIGNEKKQREREISLQEQAKEILESFYTEDHYPGHYRRLKDKEFISVVINELSEDLKIALFSYWLSKNYEVFSCINLFGKLPASLQAEVAEYYPDLGSHYNYDAVMNAFGEITNEKLTEAILKKHKFEWLVSHKEKLSLVTDEQLLDIVRNDDESKSLDWVELIPHIDRFSSINKKEALEGALKQVFSSSGVSSSSKVAKGTSESATFDLLIKNREKLDVSFRELLDALYEHKKYDGFDAFLINLDIIPSEYHQEIADKLVEDKNIYLLINGSRHLKNINVPEIIKKISETTGFPKSRSQDEYRSVSGIEAMAHNVEYIAEPWGQYMDKELIEKMIDIDPEDVARSADKLGDKVDKEKIVEILFDNEKFTFLINTAEKLDIKLDSEFAERLIESGNEGIEALFKNVTKFDKLPRSIYLNLLKFFEQEDIYLQDDYFKEFLFHFTGLQKEDAYNAISLGSGKVTSEIIQQADFFEGLKLDKEFAKFLMDRNHFTVLFNCLDKFEDINHKDVLDNILDESKHLLPSTHYLMNIIKIMEKLRGIKEDKENGKRIFNLVFLEEKRSISKSLENSIKINEFYKPPLDKTLATCYDIFGDYLTKKEYEIIKNIESGNVSKDELRELGIKKSGKDGINQLRERILKFRSEILEPDFDPIILQESDFYKQYFKSYVRFEESEWGEHGEDELDDMVNTFVFRKSTEGIKALPKEYEPSGEVKIKKIDKEAQESFEYSADFLKRYNILKKSLQGSMALYMEKKPLSKLAEEVEQKRQTVLLELKQKLSQIENPKAKININQKIEKLENINVRSVKDFESNFSILGQFDDFHDDLRRLSFYYALKKHESFGRTADEIVRENNALHEKENMPSFENIGAMINFINHIVNEETWNKYFKDKKALKAFQQIVSVRVLEEEFSRAQNQATKGTVPFEFVPTRGLLMEFSGHIADACWASKYGSIAEEFPNFSATIMVQNRNTKHERLAGASMMIETESQDGTPLLVIRGLNPIENVINGVQVEDFFDKFTTHAREIAERTGRKLAIVIDDHSGGSGTNRPVLFNFLEDKRNSLKHIRLKSKSKEDTTFNGYDITSDTYLL